MTDVIGWLSSLVLVVTIGYQVYAQWRKKPEDHAKLELFGGQLLASAGFVIYSVLLSNWIFMVTNSIMLLNALLGLILATRAVSRS